VTTETRHSDVCHRVGRVRAVRDRRDGECNQDGPAITLYNLARTQLLVGATGEARKLIDERLEFAVQLGYRELIAFTLEAVAEIASTTAAPDGDHFDRVASMVGGSITTDRVVSTAGVVMSVPSRSPLAAVSS